MSNKKENIDRLRKLVNSPFTDASAYAGLNMCDIYLNAHNRQYVLETLQERFPHATGDLNSAQEWADKLDSLKDNNAYINAFVGQVAENKALEKLEQLGLEGKLFESRIHPDDDILDSQGTKWSVKSYDPDNLSNFKSVVSEHSNSTHYIINSELYEKLKLSGDLEEYSQNGLTIIDGNYSHNEQVELATERLNAITGDISDEYYDGILDDIPIVAGIIAISNIGINISRYSNNKVTGREASTDIIKSISKLTAASGGAVAGTAIGASIGSAIFPLAGTLIGGGVGAFLGALGAREIISEYVNKWKWGNSLSAYHYFGDKYCNGFTKDMLKQIKERVLYSRNIEKYSESEMSKLANYKDELDLNSTTEPTIAALIVDETVNKLKVALSNIDITIQEIHKALREFCIDCGLAKYPMRRDASREYAINMLGAIIAENSDWLLSLNKSERARVKKMKDEINKYPNNPYKFKYNKMEILGALSMSTLKKKGETNE